MTTAVALYLVSTDNARMEVLTSFQSGWRVEYNEDRSEFIDGGDRRPRLRIGQDHPLPRIEPVELAKLTPTALSSIASIDARRSERGGGASAALSGSGQASSNAPRRSASICRNSSLGSVGPSMGSPRDVPGRVPASSGSTSLASKSWPRKVVSTDAGTSADSIG